LGFSLQLCPNDIRLRNDLYCVKWGIKLYSLTVPMTKFRIPAALKALLSKMICVFARVSADCSNYFCGCWWRGSSPTPGNWECAQTTPGGQWWRPWTRHTAAL